MADPTDPDVPIPDPPGVKNPPIVITPTVDNPNPTIQDPMGNLWAWDQDLRVMRNLSADAPDSPAQAVKNFSLEWATFGCTVFAEGVILTRFAAPTLGDLRAVLREIILAITGPPGSPPFVQYQVRDIVRDVWIDPTTDPPLVHGPESDGLHNAEVKVGGGMGDKV
jgi:hypothetical protein